MEDRASSVDRPSYTVQPCLPGVPGAPCYAWGLPALRRAVAEQRSATDYDSRQGALPGTGVLPGARWRWHSRASTPATETPAPYLDLRLRETDRADAADVRAEIEARSVTAEVALQWRTGGALPLWLAPMVPGRSGLRRLVGLLWCCYWRGTYGLRDSQRRLAAALGTTDRTLRRWLRRGEALGLVHTIHLAREPDPDHPDRVQDVCLYRIGPTLETWAGLAAWSVHRDPPRGRRVRTLVVEGDEVVEGVVEATRERARLRERALRLAARRYVYDGSQAMRDGPRLDASPEAYAPYVRAALLELERPVRPVEDLEDELAELAQDLEDLEDELEVLAPQDEVLAQDLEDELEQAQLGPAATAPQLRPVPRRGTDSAPAPARGGAQMGRPRPKSAAADAQSDKVSDQTTPPPPTGVGSRSGGRAARGDDGLPLRGSAVSTAPGDGPELGSRRRGPELGLLEQATAALETRWGDRTRRPGRRAPPRGPGGECRLRADAEAVSAELHRLADELYGSAELDQAGDVHVHAASSAEGGEDDGV